MTSDQLAGRVAANVINAVPGTQAVSHDPIITGLMWVLGVTFLVIAVGKPLRDMVRADRREKRTDQASDSKVEAETALYSHLSEQIRQYRDIADTAFKERNELVARVARLEEKTKSFDQALISIKTLKERLAVKDRYIANLTQEMRTMIQSSSEERAKMLDMLKQKDSSIASRDARINFLEPKLHDLEIRLASAEAKSEGINCPFHSSAMGIADGGYVPLAHGDEPPAQPPTKP